MSRTPTAFEGKPEAPSALRLNVLLIVGAAAWGAFGVQHFFTEYWRAGIVDAIAVILTLGVRWWALHSGDGARLILGGHLALVVTSGGIVAVSMLSGQENAMATWYLTAVPLFAAYHMGRRAAMGWALAVSVLIAAVQFSWLVVQFTPEYLPDEVTWFIGKYILLLVLLGLSIGARNATDASVAALAEREKIIRDRAAELAEARDEALEAVRAKNQFLANMSHEIRTPLNGIIGMTSVLLDADQPDDQREMVTTIQHSSTALLAVLNEILDFSKLEAGAVELEAIPFDLRDCVEDVLDMFGRAAWEKGLDLYYLPARDVPRWIEGDITYLRQVLLNLVGNAVKFTDEGEVYLAAERLDDDRLHFSVHDTGIGVPEDKQELLFHSFSQVDTSTTRRYGGTGLGLAISKRLVGLMGGDIWVDSDEGAGSTFHFTIAAPEATAPERPLTTHDRISLIGHRAAIIGGPPGSRAALEELLASWGMKTSAAEDCDEFEDDEQCEAVLVFDLPDLEDVLGREERPPIIALPLLADSVLRRAADEAHVEAIVFRPPRQRALRRALEALVVGADPPAAGQSFTAFDPTMGERLPARILVAEDNPVNQKVACTVLEKLGYDPGVAASGTEVLQAVERRNYDILFMDLQMPGMDGLETTRTIRKTLPAPEQPWIVALTASVALDQRDAVREAGMDDFISKPFDVQTLMVAIERWARQAGMLDEKRAPREARIQTPVPTDPWEQLRAMFEGSPARLADLIRSHLENGRKLVAELDAATRDEDAEAARMAAHSLKSSAAQFGSNDLSEVALRVEKLAADGDLASVGARLDEVERAWARAEQRLGREMKRLSVP